MLHGGCIGRGGGGMVDVIAKREKKKKTSTIVWEDCIFIFRKWLLSFFIFLFLSLDYFSSSFFWPAWLMWLSLIFESLSSACDREKVGVWLTDRDMYTHFRAQTYKHASTCARAHICETDRQTQIQTQTQRKTDRYRHRERERGGGDQQVLQSLSP